MEINDDDRSDDDVQLLLYDPIFLLSLLPLVIVISPAKSSRLSHQANWADLICQQGEQLKCLGDPLHVGLHHKNNSILCSTLACLSSLISPLSAQWELLHWNSKNYLRDLSISWILFLHFTFHLAFHQVQRLKIESFRRTDVRSLQDIKRQPSESMKLFQDNF